MVAISSVKSRVKMFESSSESVSDESSMVVKASHPFNKAIEKLPVKQTLKTPYFAESNVSPKFLKNLARDGTTLPRATSHNTISRPVPKSDFDDNKGTHLQKQPLHFTNASKPIQPIGSILPTAEKKAECINRLRSSSNQSHKLYSIGAQNQNEDDVSPAFNRNGNISEKRSTISDSSEIALDASSRRTDYVGRGPEIRSALDLGAEFIQSGIERKSTLSSAYAASSKERSATKQLTTPGDLEARMKLPLPAQLVHIRRQFEDVGKLNSRILDEVTTPTNNANRLFSKVTVSACLDTSLTLPSSKPLSTLLMHSPKSHERSGPRIGITGISLANEMHKSDSTSSPVRNRMGPTALGGHATSPASLIQSTRKEGDVILPTDALEKEFKKNLQSFESNSSAQFFSGRNRIDPPDGEPPNFHQNPSRNNSTGHDIKKNGLEGSSSSSSKRIGRETPNPQKPFNEPVRRATTPRSEDCTSFHRIELEDCKNNNHGLTTSFQSSKKTITTTTPILAAVKRTSESTEVQRNETKDSLTPITNDTVATPGKALTNLETRVSRLRSVRTKSPALLRGAPDFNSFLHSNRNPMHNMTNPTTDLAPQKYTQVPPSTFQFSVNGTDQFEVCANSAKTSQEKLDSLRNFQKPIISDRQERVSIKMTPLDNPRDATRSMVESSSVLPISYSSAQRLSNRLTRAERFNALKKNSEFRQKSRQDYAGNKFAMETGERKNHSENIHPIFGYPNNINHRKTDQSLIDIGGASGSDVTQGTRNADVSENSHYESASTIYSLLNHNCSDHAVSSQEGPLVSEGLSGLTRMQDIVTKKQFFETDLPLEISRKVMSMSNHLTSKITHGYNGYLTDQSYPHNQDSSDKNLLSSEKQILYQYQSCDNPKKAKFSEITSSGATEKIMPSTGVGTGKCVNIGKGRKRSILSATYHGNTDKVVDNENNPTCIDHQLSTNFDSENIDFNGGNILEHFDSIELEQSDKTAFSDAASNTLVEKSHDVKTDLSEIKRISRSTLRCYEEQHAQSEGKKNCFVGDVGDSRGNSTMFNRSRNHTEDVYATATQDLNGDACDRVTERIIEDDDDVFFGLEEEEPLNISSMLSVSGEFPKDASHLGEFHDQQSSLASRQSQIGQNANALLVLDENNEKHIALQFDLDRLPISALQDSTNLGTMVSEYSSVSSVTTDANSSAITPGYRRVSRFRPNPEDTIAEETLEDDRNTGEYPFVPHNDCNVEDATIDDSMVQEGETVILSHEESMQDAKPNSSILLSLGCALVNSLQSSFQNACRVSVSTVPLRTKIRDSGKACERMASGHCQTDALQSFDLQETEDDTILLEDEKMMAQVANPVTEETKQVGEKSKVIENKKEIADDDMKLSFGQPHETVPFVNDTEKRVWDDWEGRNCVERDHQSQEEEDSPQKGTRQESDAKKSLFQIRKDALQRLLQHSRNALELHGQTTETLRTDSKSDESSASFTSEAKRSIPVTASIEPVLLPKASEAAISAEQQVLEKFLSKLKNEGVEVLKLGRRNIWQARFLTVSREVAWPQSSLPSQLDKRHCPQCPRALLWLKQFNLENHGIDAIKGKGRGGVLFSLLIDVDMRNTNSFCKVSLPRKFQSIFPCDGGVVLTYLYDGGTRELLLCFKNNVDAQSFCTSMKIIKKVVDRWLGAPLTATEKQNEVVTMENMSSKSED